MFTFSDEMRPLIPLYITMLLEAVGSGLVASVLNIVARDDLGYSNMQVGIIWSSYNAALILGSVGMGYLSDHVRRKHALMATLLWVGLGYIFTAFSSTFEWFLVSRIFTGLCGGSYSVAVSMLYMSVAPDRLPFAIGRLGTVASLGFAIGPLISSAITAIWQVDSSSPFYTQRIYFFCAAGIYFVAAGLASRISRKMSPAWIESLTSSDDNVPCGSVSAGLCLIWSSRFFATCGVTAVYVTQVFLWREFLHLGRIEISLATTASGLATSIFQGFAFPVLVERIGFHASLTTGIALIALANALMGPLTSSGNVGLHFVCLIVFWFGVSLVEPGTPVAVARHMSASASKPGRKVHTGLAMGITSAMKYAASLLVPTAAGYLFDQHKLLVYACASGVASVGVASAVVAWRLYDRAAALGHPPPIKDVEDPERSTTGVGSTMEVESSPE